MEAIKMDRNNHKNVRICITWDYIVCVCVDCKILQVS